MRTSTKRPHPRQERSGKGTPGKALLIPLSSHAQGPHRPAQPQGRSRPAETRSDEDAAQGAARRPQGLCSLRPHGPTTASQSQPGWPSGYRAYLLVQKGVVHVLSLSITYCTTSSESRLSGLAEHWTYCQRTSKCPSLIPKYVYQPRVMHVLILSGHQPLRLLIAEGDSDAALRTDQPLADQTTDGASLILSR